MKKLLLFTAILIGAFQCFCQQAVVSGGGDASSSGGSVSYTIGQVDFSGGGNESGIVSPGVQQPYEIYYSTGIENNSGKKMKVFPNPVRHIVYLELEDFYSHNNYTYHIYSNSGVLLNQGPLTGNLTAITMGNKSSGIYFLSVLEGGKLIQQFRIVKN
jgi:hypothetical protein